MDRVARWDTPSVGAFLAVCLVSMVSGCGSKGVPPPAEKENLREIAVHYGMYMGQNRGQPPQKMDDLKAFIKKMKPNVNVDELFISPNDGQPYVLVKPKPTKTMGTSSTAIFAHEKTGKDGKRWVAYSIGKTELVDEAEFKKLLSGK